MTYYRVTIEKVVDDEPIGYCVRQDGQSLADALAEALEHYESAHYSDRNEACSGDKTATEALTAYKKFRDSSK